MAAAADGTGYWIVGSDGGLFSFGPGANFFGSLGATHLNAPIVGIAADTATGGYWMVASDGGVFAFNAPFYGSMGGVHLNKPVVGMAAVPGGGGYWLVASDGGIFTFGPGAGFYGSTGATPLNKPVVGMAAVPGGGGYWLVASDGGIFTFSPSAGIQITTPGVVYIPPESIAANCSTDVAPALDAWIASLPNGTSTSPTVVSFPSTACYEVEETIPIWQQSWVTVQGNGAKFEALTNGTGAPYIGIDYGEPDGPHYPYYMVPNLVGSGNNNSRAFMLIDDSTNITVNDVNFTGPQNCTDTPYYNCYDSALESQAGFIVSSGSNITIKGSTISHVWGDCAQVGGFTADSGVHGWLNGWTFTGNHCDHLARHGWSSNGGEHFALSGNTFSQVAYDAMDMEDDGNSPTDPVGCTTGCSGAGWANVTEHGDTYSGVAFFSIAVQCGPDCTAENITFDHNSYDSQAGPEVTVNGLNPDPYVQNIRVTNNTWDTPFQSSYVDSVDFQLVTGGLIAGNTMPQNCYDQDINGTLLCNPTPPHVYQQPVAISIQGSTNVSVQNNNVEDAAQVLEIDSSSNGQGVWSGPPSSGISQCGNSYGSNAAPQRETVC
ncbi:MAG TPA: hypothetical protein VFZ97_06285 [Acidimicrobiales bacterium]